MSELLPCQFCGSTRLTTIGSESIRCLDCLCTLYTPLPVYKNESLDDLIERWNHRVFPPEVQQAIDRMKPKKVFLRKEKCGECAYCPNCDTYCFANFCPECGQALDWSEE